MAAMAAMRRFDNGPASDTHMTAAGERRDRRYGLIWTGLAQPKPTAISINEPIGSRCANGLSVSRPSVRGGRITEPVRGPGVSKFMYGKGGQQDENARDESRKIKVKKHRGVLGGHYTTPCYNAWHVARSATG